MKNLRNVSLPFLLLLFLFGLTMAPSGKSAQASMPDSKSPLSPLYASGASTHGNINFAGKTQESFQLVCTYCHASHGGTGNLSAVLNNVIVNMSPFTLTGPVVFTARTGPGSFDDGVSAATSRICVTCHINPNRPGAATALSHNGGLNHSSGDYTGQDCATCHPHDLDGNPATIDGFMPKEGSCVSCHKQAQGARRQIVDSNGDGSGAGGDFKRASHHVSSAAIPTDDDCKVCHDQSQHRQGIVRLYNADNSATVYALDGTQDPASYENFCLACHDANGRNGDTTPFSGSGVSTAINATAWNLSSHGDGATASCRDCHDNGHGSNKIKMLAPWNYTSDGNADDPLKQQERFCYDCHAGSPAATNIQAEFGMASHHRVALTEQSAAGIQLECVSCHNPHMNNIANKVSNPDNLNQLATNNNTFCLACHDNLATSPLPAGVSFGTFTIKGFRTGNAATVWDKSAYVNSAHAVGDAALPNIQCKHCHTNHGSNINGYAGAVPAQTTQDLLKATYIRLEGTSYYPWSNPTGTGFALCFGCHTADDGKAGLRDVRNDAWAGEHSSHDDDGPCIYCHDVHAPYDTGEFGLVNFEYNRLYSDLTYLAGFNASTAFDRTLTNACGISCHGVTHSAKKYTVPPNYDTTPGSVYPFGFIQPASAAYTLQTLTDPLIGIVNNPESTLQNGLFNGNGADTYINFANNPEAALARTALVIETQLMPQNIPTSAAVAPASNDQRITLLLNYWLSSLFAPWLPMQSSQMNAGDYEAVIFDRGAEANYRVSLIRNNSWATFKAPPGVASFAFWINPVDKHSGADWKVVVTNYERCPIVSDHWYNLIIKWDAGKAARSPVDIYVDDQGPTGDDVGELWQKTRNCTDWNPIQALVPAKLQPMAKDQITASPGPFTIGARADTFGNVFSGLIKFITLYPEDTARNQLLDWKFSPANNP